MITCEKCGRERDFCLEKGEYARISRMKIGMYYITYGWKCVKTDHPEFKHSLKWCCPRCRMDETYREERMKETTYELTHGRCPLCGAELAFEGDVGVCPFCFLGFLVDEQGVIA